MINRILFVAFLVVASWVWQTFAGSSNAWYWTDAEMLDIRDQLSNVSSYSHDSVIALVGIAGKLDGISSKLETDGMTAAQWLEDIDGKMNADSYNASVYQSGTAGKLGIYRVGFYDNYWNAVRVTNLLAVAGSIAVTNGLFVTNCVLASGFSSSVTNGLSVTNDVLVHHGSDWPVAVTNNVRVENVANSVLSVHDTAFTSGGFMPVALVGGGNAVDINGQFVDVRSGFIGVTNDVLVHWAKALEELIGSVTNRVKVGNSTDDRMWVQNDLDNGMWVRNDQGDPLYVYMNNVEDFQNAFTTALAGWTGPINGSMQVTNPGEIADSILGSPLDMTIPLPTAGEEMWDSVPVFDASTTPSEFPDLPGVDFTAHGALGLAPTNSEAWDALHSLLGDVNMLGHDTISNTVAFASMGLPHRGDVNFVNPDWANNLGTLQDNGPEGSNLSSAAMYNRILPAANGFLSISNYSVGSASLLDREPMPLPKNVNMISRGGLRDMATSDFTESTVGKAWSFVHGMLTPVTITPVETFQYDYTVTVNGKSVPCSFKGSWTGWDSSAVDGMYYFMVGIEYMLCFIACWRHYMSVMARWPEAEYVEVGDLV